MQIKYQIATLYDLYSSLPEGQLSIDLMAQIIHSYELEMELMRIYARNAKEPLIIFTPFRRCGCQFIATFELKDLSLPAKNQCNWYLENTSQWLYAGCICLENARVSTHH